MLIGVDVERFVVAAEAQQVERREVARRVVEEHVFRTRVRGADRTRLRAGVPVVDRRVELDAGIGGSPGGEADLLPEVAGFQRLRNFVAEAGAEIPILVIGDGVQEFIRHAHRVVGILAGDRQVGFAVPIGIVGVERHLLVALLGELDDAQDVVLRNAVALGFADRELQLRVLQRIEAGFAFAPRS